MTVETVVRYRPDWGEILPLSADKMAFARYALGFALTQRLTQSGVPWSLVAMARPPAPDSGTVEISEVPGIRAAFMA